ncbi:MAG: GntR family transcriptional regulator [Geminicoccaceae bacterium]
MARERHLKVARRPLDRRAADVLREAILSGRFKPGQRLVETSLAQQLEVSRGTLRAALSELAHEGLVLQVAYTKWLVSELTPHDAWELCTLRSGLEGLAARLAAERRDPAGAASLEQAFARLRSAVAEGRRGAASAADKALHTAIVAMTRHQRLAQHYTIIEQQVQRYIAASNALLVDPEDIVRQHEPLVRAVLDGDAATAEALAREHNLSEGRILVAHLEATLAPAETPDPAGSPEEATDDRSSAS